MKGIAVLAAAVLLAACSSGPGDDVLGSQVSATPSPSATSSPSATAEPQPSPDEGNGLIRFPAPDTRVPTKPGRLARRFEKNERDLKRAIEMWLDGGGKRRSAAGHRVALGALWQQRMLRTLAKKPDLARRVVAKLPSWIARKVDVHVGVGSGLRALAAPIEPPVRMRVTPVDSHRKLMRFYKEAGRRYDIPDEILASLNFVESKFGRFMGPSSAGAKGPMQFMPATWDIYGNGDIWDPHDAIVAAARYLSASGAPERMNDALYAYNHSDAYVRAIRVYAAEIAKRPHSFYSYYFWQVFVRTTEGDVQLTGPGKDQ